MLKIRKSSDIGAFLFSDEANVALRNFIDFEVTEISDPSDFLGLNGAQASKCLKELVSLSKKDLRVRNAWL